MSLNAQEVIPTSPKAQSKPLPAKSSTAQVNYGPAFQKLIELGFPDAKGGTYVELKFADDEEGRRVGTSFYGRFDIKRSGNAWLLPPDDPKSPARSVIHDQHLIAKVAAKEKRNLLVQLFAGSDDKTRAGVRKAEWTEVDAAQEITDIIKQLETDESLAGLFDADRWQYDQSANSDLGKLLMMACHAHQAGHPTEANQLAHLILSKAPYSFKVIDYVIEQLAAKAYRDLLDQLYTDQDWKTYLAGIRELSTKYPRGWTAQPGLKILIPQVVAHLRT